MIAIIFDLANRTASTYAITSTNVTIVNNTCNNNYAKICTEVRVPVSYNVSHLTYFSTFNVSVENSQSVYKIVGFYKNATHILEIFYSKDNPHYWSLNQQNYSLFGPELQLHVTVELMLMVMLTLIMLVFILDPSRWFQPKNTENVHLFSQHNKI